jgi:hypothetical protein
VASVIGSATMAKIPSTSTAEMMVESAESSIADDRQRAGRYL